MRLLPCLRSGAGRLWLPLTPDSGEILTAAVLASARQPGAFDRARTASAEVARSADPLHAKLCRRIEADPALLIYSALAISSATGTSPMSQVAVSNWQQDEVTIGQLATWLQHNAVGRFASGDAYMSAPVITPSIRAHWNQLAEDFRVMPRHTWIPNASLWLEVFGNVVDPAWQRTWPRLVPDSDNANGEVIVEDAGDQPGTPMLQQIARQSLRQKSLEQHFGKQLHASKVAAIKQLAYGLSHEINNPLANISTRAQQLQRGENDPSKKATLQRIIDQVYRAHAMIADLMFYANPTEPRREPFNLNEVVRNIADSFAEEAERQSIRLEVQIPEVPVIINADPTMIGEATSVLIRNAIEAIGCQGTAVVSIVSDDSNSTVDAGTPRSITIHVADSGPGVSKEARVHAFDPYYSGREAGRGLGLGLCRAYRIAKLHHARIQLAGGPAGCVATLKIPVRARAL